jgi:hypothetical protein
MTYDANDVTGLLESINALNEAFTVWVKEKNDLELAHAIGIVSGQAQIVRMFGKADTLPFSKDAVLS